MRPQKKGQDWNTSASHVTHQVGVSDPENDPADPENNREKAERKPSLKNKVSFDQSEASKDKSLERQDSYAGVTRVSFEKPADLYVTSTTIEEGAEKPAEPAEVAEGAAKPAENASNTGTAKRKKKKRDEVHGVLENM